MTTTTAATDPPSASVGECQHVRYLKESDVSEILELLVFDALQKRPTDLLRYVEEWAERHACPSTTVDPWREIGDETEAGESLSHEKGYAAGKPVSPPRSDQKGAYPAEDDEFNEL